MWGSYGEETKYQPLLSQACALQRTTASNIQAGLDHMHAALDSESLYNAAGGVGVFWKLWISDSASSCIRLTQEQIHHARGVAKVVTSQKLCVGHQCGIVGQETLKHHGVMSAYFCQAKLLKDFKVAATWKTHLAFVHTKMHRILPCSRLVAQMERNKSDPILDRFLRISILRETLLAARRHPLSPHPVQQTDEEARLEILCERLKVYHQLKEGQRHTFHACAKVSCECGSGEDSCLQSSAKRLSHKAFADCYQVVWPGDDIAANRWMSTARINALTTFLQLVGGYGTMAWLDKWPVSHLSRMPVNDADDTDDSRVNTKRLRPISFKYESVE